MNWKFWKKKIVEPQKHLYIRKVKNLQIPAGSVFVEMDDMEEWESIISSFIKSNNLDIFITRDNRHYILLNEITFMFDANGKKNCNYTG